MPVDPRRPPGQTLEERLVGRVAELERQMRTLQAYANGGTAGALPVVDSLGPAGRLGRVFVLSTDKKLYVDTGTSWVAQT